MLRLLLRLLHRLLLLWRRRLLPPRWWVEDRVLDRLDHALQDLRNLHRLESLEDLGRAPQEDVHRGLPQRAHLEALHRGARGDAEDLQGRTRREAGHHLEDGRLREVQQWLGQLVERTSSEHLHHSTGIAGERAIDHSRVHELQDRPPDVLADAGVHSKDRHGGVLLPQLLQRQALQLLQQHGAVRGGHDAVSHEPGPCAAAVAVLGTHVEGYISKGDTA
mmetsp:Transcript_6575/g.19983  ORF Transcript_6575/g.19983 Transcript_6575/m.19983 type:complete len:220 (-) Transcript_6575:429-1088(-)